MGKIIVEKDAVGTRIDKFLAKEFFSYTRGEVIRAIRAGGVFVNDVVVKPSYVLSLGDVVLARLDRERKSEEIAPNESITLDILFENDDFLVINKPAGLQVHPDRAGQTNTLVNALVSCYPEILSVHDDSLDAHRRPGIVHRLDRDTSGVMVIAKNMQTLHALKNLFKSRAISKEYIAIVSGVIVGEGGVIDRPLAKSSDYSKQVIANARTKTTVRSAITNFTVLRRGEDWTAVRVMPKTGRTHQIRVHFAAIGHPIAGDILYGKEASGMLRAQRQLLHALRLEFALNEQKYSFTAPVPGDILEITGNID